MDKSLSTFDQLVKSLSTEETQSLLNSIQQSMDEFSSAVPQEEKEDNFSEKIREHQAEGLSNEPFFAHILISAKMYIPVFFIRN